MMDLIQERLLHMFGKLSGWLMALSFLLCTVAVANGQSTSTGGIRGTVTDPSAFWKFSSTATSVRPTASPEPFNVCTSSGLP